MIFHDKVCTVPGCTRRKYARGLCQTHHRQLLARGRMTPIRPYRPRRAGTVKFAGLRLSAMCVAQLTKLAEEHGLSSGAAIAMVLESWSRRKRK